MVNPNTNNEATYIGQLILKIDGQDAPKGLMEDILQVYVEESLHRPAMFTLAIQNAYYPGSQQEHAWMHQELFAIGKAIEIGFKSGTTASAEFEKEEEGCVLKGEITAMETHFTSGSQAPMIVRGYDISHRLHRGRHNRSFQNYTDTDIVKEIAQQVGIPPGAIDGSGKPHEYVFQENQTNMEFLRERAARNGFELFVQDGKLHFRKPKEDESLELQWLTNLSSFRVRVSSAEQVQSVEVRGWDYKNKQEIVSTRSSAQVITETDHGKGEKTSTAFQGKPPTPKVIVVDQPISTAKEADTLAQALLDELGGEFVHADAQAEGNPKIQPGRVVKLKNMGKYSGKYYVTETRHIFSERHYTTEFSVRGLRGGDLLEILSPPNHLQPGQTLLVGVVTDNQDPKGLGRVRVWFPTLTPQQGPDAHASYWARVVSTGAGGNRGFDCLPEINDEVLVAFEHGDIHRPYIIGNVWNGKDAPPEKVGDSVVNGKVRLRTFKTRIGHMLQCVEENKGSSKQGIYIKTEGGHWYRLNDTDKFVEIETSGGHTLRLDDSNRTISMTSTGDINIKAGGTGLSNRISLAAGDITLTGTQKITLNVGVSTVEVTQAGITIQTAATLNLRGGATTNVQGGALVQIVGGIIKLN
ncbi:MAG TPA: VgrG-related protein [Allocoleopsis sp.]